MSEETKPQLEDVVEAGVRRGRVVTRTATPAKVLAYQAEPSPRCKVQPLLKARLRSGATVSMPPVSDVQVLWPCGGGFAMEARLEVGEEVMLIVCDRDITAWVETGEESEPRTGRLHSIKDAVAVPGIRSRPKRKRRSIAKGELFLGNETGAAPWIRWRTTPPSVIVEAPAILLGEGATLGVARQTDPVAPNATLAAWFAAIAAVTGVPAPVGNIGLIATASAIVKAK